MDEGKESPLPKEELSGKLGGKLERDKDGNWTLTLSAHTPENERILNTFTDPGDDSYILIPGNMDFRPGERKTSFRVSKGPQIKGTPLELAELKVWKPTSLLRGDLSRKQRALALRAKVIVDTSLKQDYNKRVMLSAPERGLSEPITGEAYRRMFPEDFAKEACELCMTPVEPLTKPKKSAIIFQLFNRGKEKFVRQKEAQAASK